ncbi:MAG: hypothetical protein AAFX44_04480 [Pseudomonadota bacterium]
MRILQRIGFGLAASVAALAALLAVWNLTSGSPAIAPSQESTATFDAQALLVAVDGDMAGTAYADGKLHPVADAADLLIGVDLKSLEQETFRVEASNSVMGWPGSAALSSDGRFAYVIETRGQIDRQVEALDNVYLEMPNGSAVTTVELARNKVVDTRNACRRPSSVDVAPNGAWLLVACADATAELAVVALTDGIPSAVRNIDLNLPDFTARPGVDEGLTYGMIHPDGAAAGVIQTNAGVALVTFELDDAGIPRSAQTESPTYDGKWLSVARWTASGEYLLVADVAWGPKPTDAVFNGNGAVHAFALAPQNDKRGVVSSAEVSRSPEAIELNAAGDLLIAVNMERTYLPGGPLAVIPGRDASSLSLIAVDSATGNLETVSAPVGFKGILPEDAVFDRDGDMLAVVVYQDHDAPRSHGWLEFFAVDRSADAPTLTPTGRQLPLPRGAHDLVIQH